MYIYFCIYDSISNVGAREGIENPQDVLQMRRSLIIKKACLCLLQLYRTNNDCVEIETWPQIINGLLGESDLGIITSAMSLLIGFTNNK